jgi:hypothetical protein
MTRATAAGNATAKPRVYRHRALSRLDSGETRALRRNLNSGWSPLVPADQRIAVSSRPQIAALLLGGRSSSFGGDKPGSVAAPSGQEGAPGVGAADDSSPGTSGHLAPRTAKQRSAKRWCVAVVMAGAGAAGLSKRSSDRCPRTRAGTGGWSPRESPGLDDEGDRRRRAGVGSPGHQTRASRPTRGARGAWRIATAPTV